MRMYSYTGSVSSISVNPKESTRLSHADLILYDSFHLDQVAPVRIQAYGGLADYIMALESTDAEERYMQAVWYYDELLHLQRIEYHCKKSNVLAKVIVQKDTMSPKAYVFGPQEFLDAQYPVPMSQEQMREYNKFLYEKQNGEKAVSGAKFSEGYLDSVWNEMLEE